MNGGSYRSSLKGERKRSFEHADKHGIAVGALIILVLQVIQYLTVLLVYTSPGNKSNQRSKTNAFLSRSDWLLKPKGNTKKFLLFWFQQ